MIVQEKDIGGAQVVRWFKSGGELLAPGTSLSREAVLAFPPNNRQALIDSGYIAVYPPHDDVAPSAPAGEADLHFVSRGFGRYDVIKGVKINADFLTLEQVQELGYVPPSKKDEPVAN